MRQKLLFVWHVLIFNVIKPFPSSSYYFNNHFRSPTQIAADYYSISHYRGIVNFGKEHFFLTALFYRRFGKSWCTSAFDKNIS